MQLGLPKEHTDALVGALRDGRAPLQAQLAAESLRLGKLESLRWRVHEDAGAARAHAVEVYLGVRDQATAPAASATDSHPQAVPPAVRGVELRMDADTLAILHAEMRAAKESVESIAAK